VRVRVRVRVRASIREKQVCQALFACFMKINFCQAFSWFNHAKKYFQKHAKKSLHGCRKYEKIRFVVAVHEFFPTALVNFS
jgi:hypothetical protein